MGRTSVCMFGAAFAAAVGIGAASAGEMPASSAALSRQALGSTAQARPLSGSFGMNPAQKAAAGYNKVDNALAAIAERAASLPKSQLLSAIPAASPKARFNVADPQIIPAVLVDILVQGDPADAESRLQQLGVQHTSVYSNLISGWLPVDRIKDAQALSGVKFMRTSLAYTNTGSITTQGDFVQHSDRLRASTLVPGLTGAGITVGILSDSFACTTAIRSEAQDISTNDLPANTQILSEYNALSSNPQATSSCQGATDEGRGMAQIVYDVAPGTSIKFYTAFNGEADFANGIIALQAAGAQIIDDDVGYFDEPTFQDGIVAQAINTVKGKGVAYFSSAGNSGRQAFEAKWVDSGTVGAAGADNAGEKLMAFTSADGTTTQNFLPLTVPAFQEQSLQILQWDQPYTTGAPNSGGNTSSLDICLTDSTGAVLHNFCSGPTPVGTDSVAITGLDTDGTTTAYGVQVGLVAGTPPPGRIKIIFGDDGGGSQAGAAFATYSPTIQGHPLAAGANAVGASYFRANPVCLPAVYPNYLLESYSSAGGDPVLFDVTGKALATPVIRQKPNFVAPDGGNTTFFAQILGARGDSVLQCENAPGTYNFFGTSAAGPHAAGIAALLMQAQPNATPDLITQALQKSTIVNMAVTSPATGKVVVQTGTNFDTGYGFVQADAALAQVLPLVSPSASSLAFGDQRVGVASAAQTVTLTNSGGYPATISAVAATGDFAVASNTCPAATATLAPGATCTIGVTATPTAAGARSGSVTVTSNAPNSPGTITLSANGVQSKALLTPKTLSFGSITQGSSTSSQVVSLAQTVTLIDVGTAPLNITGISSGDPAFTQTNNCPAALAVGASCTITVNFAPSNAQQYSSTLTLASDGASSGDSQVAVSGTGVAPSSGGGAFAPMLLLPGLLLAGLRRRRRD